ncbi:hypothetical protein PoB_004398100 [Plakobranchus ocellatus]|uniref:Uncharacterized protein n=1 Tax=Plakobranchus ocellatus TaxID=259542 RepID=A0AAV4BF99_9GAST|nr:hypothetical protein PoB_004398100 [Plakobranchus ocellatus]
MHHGGKRDAKVPPASHAVDGTPGSRVYLRKRRHPPARKTKVSLFCAVSLQIGNSTEVKRGCRRNPEAGNLHDGGANRSTLARQARTHRHIGGSNKRADPPAVGAPAPQLNRPL